MDEHRIREHKAEVEAELRAVEAEFDRLENRRSGLRQVVSGYEAMLAGQAAKASAFSDAVDGETKISPTTPMPLGLVIPSRSNENLTTRSTRILKAAAPKYLTPREIMVALEAEGWTTTSTNKIGVVRNTMADLVKRVPNFDKRSNGDGSVGYGWVEQVAVQSGGG